jgi:hypothetical protein
MGSTKIRNRCLAGAVLNEVMSNAAEPATDTRQTLVIALGFGAYSASSNDTFYPLKLYWSNHYGLGIYMYAPFPHPYAKNQ